MMTKSRNRRKIAVFLLVLFVAQTIAPTISYGLTSGPSQPEFSSFEPVATTNMVNEFTGDFTYNLPVVEIPGPHGSGYAMSLSYHSGASPEEESSWVGYGWNINPGAINRSTRGFPDDFNGQKVKYHNKVPNNWTVTVGASANPEAFSFDVPVSAQSSLRYNNYKGFGYNAGAGVTLGKGIINLGFNVSNGQGSFSLNVSASNVLNAAKKKAEASEKDKPLINVYNSVEDYKKNRRKLGKNTSVNVNYAGGNYGILTHSSYVRPSNISDYVGGSISGSLGFIPTATFLQIGPSVNLFGSVTTQVQTPEKELDAYGFMYSSNADDQSMMDYYVEKDNSFQKGDVFIGMPQSNADIFSATGEGISGGFKLNHKRIGHFKPNRTVSETIIGNVGGEINLGFDIGLGLDLGLGVSAITHRGWGEEHPDFSSFAQDRNNVFFRFNNDLGGSWLHNTGDEKIQAKIVGGGPVGVKSFRPLLTGVSSAMNNGEMPGRSSYIGYRTNEEIAESRNNGNYYNIYSLREDTYLQSEKARLTEQSQIESGIGELAVFNENGSRYVYGLPVYSKKEKDLQFGLQKAPASAVDKNFVVHYKDNKTKIGEERDGAYAASYLLTEITTPDYIDRTFDGPSYDDLGGYTRFNYLQHAGGDTDQNWYQWRMPYTGLSYSRNSMSDPKDDLGSYREGLKELYYLQSVETKTHAGIFITSDREDGVEAAESAITNKNAKGTKSLKKLDRIEIYSLGDVKRVADNLYPVEGAKPIKTVHFKYDYSLSNDLPNATSGKLTLKKVFFEYEGITEARISPYTFDYEYPDEVYPSKYQGIKDEYTGLVDQNPDYDVRNIDAWGNYQENGADRYDGMRKWVNQKASATFDPAAWQLKTIKLPTGGQIHVQYEADDYSYVQDQEAHSMIRLSTESSEDNNRYYLNTSADLDLTNDELLIMARLIRKRYIQDKKKMYFKFLYQLMGNGQPDLTSCNSEYITGYLDIETAGVDTQGRLFITLPNSGAEDYNLPKQVCKDFVLTQRLGNLNTSGNCDASSSGIDPNNDPIDIIKQLGNLAKSVAIPGILCKNINYDLSYFRLPLPISKKGGGVRVKRLLVYDKGLENNPVLYGNEYLYEVIDELTGTVRSSGVATNEPTPIREENILVDLIDREGKTIVGKVIKAIFSGRDKRQSEGFLGETILPAPSIGYSQVVVKNIHSGVTGTGFNVRQYHTAKSNPFTVERTQIKDKSDFVPWAGFGVNIFINNTWLSQGFVFKQNSMNGRMKSDINYTGIYSPELAKANLVTSQEYIYFAEDEQVPVTTDMDIGVTYENPGKEIELTFADKAIIEEQYDANVEGDGTVGIIFPIPLPPFFALVPQTTFYPSVTHTRSQLHTHATSKIIRYPAIVKEVITRRDGVKHRQVNLAFDKYTGQPVAVRSYDEFEGSYLTQTIPASWKYDNFGPMANDEGRVIEAAMGYSSASGEDRLHFTDGESCALLPEFTKGDLLELGNGALYHVKRFDFSTDEIVIEPSRLSKSAPPATFASVKVLRSGNNNRLSDQAGQLVFHSTSPDINLPAANDATRYTSNEFTDDLNAAMSSQADFILDGPYDNMNMTNYVSALPSGCDVNLRDVRIRNASFVYFNRDGSLDLYLRSFDIECGEDNWETINADSL